MLVEHARSPKSRMLVEHARSPEGRMLVEHARSPESRMLVEHARSPESRMLVEHARSPKKQDALFWQGGSVCNSIQRTLTELPRTWPHARSCLAKPSSSWRSPCRTRRGGKWWAQFLRALRQTRLDAEPQCPQLLLHLRVTGLWFTGSYPLQSSY